MRSRRDHRLVLIVRREKCTGLLLKSLLGCEVDILVNRPGRVHFPFIEEPIYKVIECLGLDLDELRMPHVR